MDLLPVPIMLRLPAPIMDRLRAHITVHLLARIRDIRGRLPVLITERLLAHHHPAPITDRLLTSTTIRRPVVDSI